MAVDSAPRENGGVSPNSFETRLSEAFSRRRAHAIVPSQAPPPAHIAMSVGRHEIAVVRHDLVTAPIETAVAASNAVPATAPSIQETADIPVDPVTALLQKNAPPAPYAPGQQPSTDPGVYSNPDYIAQSNLNLIRQQTNHENQYRYDVYKNGVQNWAANGMQGDPPAPPKYETVDEKGFYTWWAQYTQDVSKNAPPQTFISNQIPNNGYYGATIWPRYSA